MRQVYAHDAVIVLSPSADERSPAAAITEALGGHPPVWSGVSRDGDRVRLRILYATSPDRVAWVRARIDATLADGDWNLIESGCAPIAAGERDHARRLLRSR
jgi:hypothetical protein